MVIIGVHFIDAECANMHMKKSTMWGVIIGHVPGVHFQIDHSLRYGKMSKLLLLNSIHFNRKILFKVVCWRIIVKLICWIFFWFQQLYFQEKSAWGSATVKWWMKIHQQWTQWTCNGFQMDFIVLIFFLN